MMDTPQLIIPENSGSANQVIAELGSLYVSNSFKEVCQTSRALEANFMATQLINNQTQDVPIDQICIKLVAMSVYSFRWESKNTILNNVHINAQFDRTLVPPQAGKHVPLQQACTVVCYHTHVSNPV